MFQGEDDNIHEYKNTSIEKIDVNSSLTSSANVHMDFEVETWSLWDENLQKIKNKE